MQYIESKFNLPLTLDPLVLGRKMVNTQAPGVINFSCNGRKLTLGYQLV